MTAELLQSVGQALYGLQWQSDLARALGVSSRTVRNWSAGGPIPDAKRQAMSELCVERANHLLEVRGKLARS